VVFVLVPAAWFAVVLFAVMMCHLAARSDHSYDAALADGIAGSYFGDHWAVPLHIRAARLPLDPRHPVHRATGRP
jgi:hypothetical protein